MDISNINITRCEPSGAFCHNNNQRSVEFICEGSFVANIGWIEINNQYEICLTDLSNSNIFSNFRLSINGYDNNIISFAEKGDHTINFIIRCDADINVINENSCVFQFKLCAKKIDRIKRDRIKTSCNSPQTTLNYPECLCNRFNSCEICRIEPVPFEYAEGTMNDNKVQLATIIMEESSNITPTLLSATYGNVRLQHCQIGQVDNNRYPVYFDITELDYPRTDIQIEVQVTCGVKTITINKEIPYKASPYFNKMYVSLSHTDNLGNNILADVNDRATVELPDICLDNGGSINKDFIIGNFATMSRIPGTGVRIRNYSCKVTADDNGLSRIVGRIDKLNVTSADEIIVNQQYQFPIVFDLNEIQDIRVGNGLKYLDVLLNINFEYVEDRFSSVQNGGMFPVTQYQLISTPTPYRDFNCTLKVRIHGTQPQDWFSVDFGTSAVVAYMTTNPGEDNTTYTPINLKELKTALIHQQYPPDEPEKRKDLEQPGGMIASTLYLNPLGKDESTEFKDLKVWFSPSRGMVNPQYQLPCIKYMVGNRNIPNINLAEDERQILPTQISEIMNSAYNQLCTHYLGAQNINALVFTVPNTFTPLHISNIRSILMQQIQTLAYDNLEFISESDAVLCLYLNGRRRHLNNDPSLVRRTSEHILVFDMGAGTLDLTYAECKYDSRNNYNVNSVEIKGRMGINKAGNYIDYLLGEIIIDLLVTKFGMSEEDDSIKALDNILTIRPVGGEPVGRNYGLSRTFKDYLCNKVKTILNEDDNTYLPPLDDEMRYEIGFYKYEELGKITVGDIKNHDLFIQYIESCTVNVMNDFACLYGEGGKLRLDYIFISGRTISINAIKESLMNIIHKIGYNTLSNKIRKIRNDNDNDNIGSKLAVAEGALNYVKLKRFTTNFEIRKKIVYGNYGILLEGTDRPWISLINHNTIPNENQTLVSNIQIDCHQVRRIKLCHTYKMNPANDIASNNYDSTTILDIYEIPISISGGHNMMTIKLEINNENDIRYDIGPNHIQLTPHDDYNNESLRKSLWPVIYD